MAYPSPRRRLNPALRNACIASGRPQWQLMIVAGINYQSRLSQLICAETIPATDATVDQLLRIADAVGFPRAQLFLFDEQTERQAVAR
jgi:hypothetical protein